VTGPRGGKLHDFDPGAGVSTLQQINLPLGAPFTPSFQWDQPFKSLGGAGSASDLDIYVIGADGTTGVASSITNNVGGDPLELLRFTNDGSFDLDHNNIPDTKFFVRIELVSGPAPGLMKYVDNGRAATIVTFATDSSTDVGHSNAASALGVAASAFFFTPAFGQTPPVLNSFSSKGGTLTLFDPTGNRLPSPILHGSPPSHGRRRRQHDVFRPGRSPGYRLAAQFLRHVGRGAPCGGRDRLAFAGSRRKRKPDAPGNLLDTGEFGYRYR
jgi:hypothetical protein